MITILIQLRRAERRELAALLALLLICLVAVAACYVVFGQMAMTKAQPFRLGVMALSVTAVYCALLRVYLLMVHLMSHPTPAQRRLSSATAETAAAQTGLSSG